MALKYKIKKLEDVPEAVRSLYKAEGDEFVLDAEGVVPKERLDEFRNNNISLQQQLDKLKDVDPDKYAELLKIDQEVREGKLIKEGKLEEVVNLRVDSMKRTYESEKTQLTTRLTKAEAQLAKLMIDDSVKSEAIKLGVATTAVEDVVLRARGVYSVDNGAVVPKGADGQVIYGKDGKTPMPVGEWLGGLKESAPHLFAKSQGGGAGGGRGTGASGSANMSPVDKIAAGLSAGQQTLRDLPTGS